MLSCIDEFATQQLMQCKCGWLLLTAAAIKVSPPSTSLKSIYVFIFCGTFLKTRSSPIQEADLPLLFPPQTSFFRRNEREGCSKHLSISTQRHVSKTRTVLFAISFAWLATSVAFARQLSQSSFITCVAPFSGDGFACIGVAKLNQQECADFATYNGSEGQSFTGPAVATGATYYFVPYTATCQQSITKLSQEGKGSFSECTTASTSEADYLLRVAISKGLITVPGSGKRFLAACP